VKRKQAHHNLLLAVFLSVLLFPITVQTATAQPDTGRAVWKSMLVPGWGHYYVDRENWQRGQVHLAADAVLIASLLGFHARASNLQDQSFTLANLRAGINLDERDRMFRLAIGNFDDLQSYNDHQLRTRNWNRLIEEIPENRWNWEHEDDRRHYRELRERSERARQQVPAIISLLVVNRIVSGLSAYMRAREQINTPSVRIEPVISPGNTGYAATLSFRF
jgi:hypothetical protein